VTTTPEPTAVTDAYGMVKSLLHRSPDASVQLVVNMTANREEADGVYERMNRVTRAFLSRSIDYGGSIPLDPAVAAAVRYRLPFSLYAPDGPATRAVGQIALKLAGLDEAVSDHPRRGGFFARLAGWFAGADHRPQTEAFA
jgi:flagellar biosynthesis protein FlhG